jgi:hypothetical protein
MRSARSLGSLRSVGPWQLVALVVGLVAVILVVSTQLHGGATASPPPEGTAPIRAASATASPVTPAPSSAPPARGASSTPPARPARVLSGRALATAWLTGYLNRSSRDDARWVDAIRDITDPDLLSQLQSSGPDAVGLFGLNSWRVTAITPYSDSDQPVDTPSRQVLAYNAAVTDGRATEQKPFLLYCYRSDDERWTVSLVEQPYTSEN